MRKQNVIHNNSYKTKEKQQTTKIVIFLFLQSMIFSSHGDCILAKLLCLMKIFLPFLVMVKKEMGKNAQHSLEIR